MGKALYRKYRPLRLADVVGQNQVTDTLSNSLEQGKLSHAYLFVGPRGTGKTSVARIFAHEINGFQYILEDDYVDIIEIDGASNRGVENIRELRERVTIAPTSGKYKVYIIDEVHMLTKEAFNALLKTLEEPPEHVIFIMATTDAYKVPITITSRAQTYTFKLADHNTMLEFLKSVSQKEGIKIDDAALKIITQRGGGSFRDSLSLLDQISTLSDDLITGELVTKALGLPEEDVIRRLLTAYIEQENDTILLLLKQLLESGLKPETLVEEIINFIVEQPRLEWMELLAKLTEVRAPFAEAKILVALCGCGSGKALQSRINTVAAKPTTPVIQQLQKDIVETPREMPVSSADFSWDNFLRAVQAQSSGTYTHLAKCRHELEDNVLHIYPGSSFAQSLLNKKDRKDVLLAAAPGVKITIHEYGSSSIDAKKDETLAKISDIMGGEVKNDGGDNPFN